MPTFGLLFMLAGALLIRQVATGRVKNIPEDARALFTAGLSGDSGGIQSVAAERGTNVSAASDELVGSLGAAGTDAAAGAVAGAAGGNNASFAAYVQRLGSQAAGYRLGATGPQFYDCSGLIWRAAYTTKKFTGPRFTTSNFRSIARGWCTKVDTPTVGTIILWPTHHMGIYVGNDSMYSARSTAKGIGLSTISGDSSYFGSQPEYWSINA